MSEDEPYDYRGCQSLFGYAQAVHERSGGVCQLCDAGAGPEPNFDFWRQLTVEHLIGASQGGGYDQILRALKLKFPGTPRADLESWAEQLELMNTVSACSFCNSTTSQARHDVSMNELLARAEASWNDILRVVEIETKKVLGKKRAEVAWKLASIRKRFDSAVHPGLRARRSGHTT